MAEFPWQNTLNKSRELSGMAMGSGIQTGNPMVDMALNMFMGNMLAPVPGAGQSILDAYKMKDRSRDYMSLMRKAVGSSTIAQHIGGPGGFNTDGLFGGALTQFAGMSGVMDNSVLQAMNGGNPVKALMGLKANMTGMTMGQAFGQVGNADNETVLAAFKGMQDQLFKTKTISKTDLRNQEAEHSAALLKGMTPAAKAAMSKFIKKSNDKESFDFDAFSKEHKETSNSFLDRQQKLKGDYEDYSTEIKNLQDAKSKYVDSIGDENLKKDAGENYDKHSAAAVQEISNKLKQNAASFEKLEKEKADYEKSISSTLDANKSVMSFRTQHGQKINVQADPEKMRGFKIQELTKSMTMAMDLNMGELSPEIRNDKKIGVRDKAHMLGSAFAEHSVGTLSAVRDLTGVETADGAMEQLNSLLGNSTKYNLATKEGGAGAEDLIRRVKAAGRNAGVGLDAIMEVINQVKEISAAHPELKYAGGDVHMETSIKALNTTSALTAAMGGSWTRTMGGQAEVSRLVVENAQEAQSAPITNELMGITGLIQGDKSLSADKKKMMMDELNKWANSEDSVFAKGNHGFNPADKADLFRKMATIHGRRSIDYYNSAYSQSSVVAGHQFHDAHKEYNFGGAANGKVYSDVNTTIMNAVASLDGATDADVLRITKEVADDLSSMSANGMTPEKVLSVSRKLSNGRNVTLNNGDTGSLIENLIGDKNSMLAYTLHSKMKDPKFKAQYDNQLKAQKSYATEEARMDKELASLRQPFFDTIIQAYMGGSFAKGKDEIMKLVSTPLHQQRASDILDALNANSANTTADSYKNVMMESLGGKAGLSKEAVDKNLDLLGITDSAQRAATHAQRRFWDENNQGYSDFTAITKGNTLTSVAEAYKELKKNGKISPELLAKLNTDEKTLRSGGAFMEGAHITATNQTGEEYMNKSPMSEILKQASHIGFESSKKSLLELKSKELSAYYQSEEEVGDKEQSHSQLSLLSAAGYITHKAGKTGNTWSDFDWDKGQITGYNKYLKDREEGVLLDGGRLDALLVGGKDVKKAYGVEGKEALSAGERKYLSEQGVVSVDKNGVTSWDDAKLKELTYKRKGLKAASENQLFSVTGDRLDEVKKNIDTNVTKIDQGLAVEQLKDMTSSMTTAAKGITTELSRLISVFTAALGN